MAKDTIRTTVDIPAPTYRKLKEQAARQHRSVRELVLKGIDQVLIRPEPAPASRVKFPLIGSGGPKVKVTSERIYELIELP